MMINSSVEGLLLLFVCGIVVSQPEAHFKAAVYEHSLIHPTECQIKKCTRSEVLQVMERNIIIYEEQIKLAAAQSVDIIVFPEDGLYGWYFTRESLQPFLEYVPDAVVESWIPCEDPDRYREIGPSDIQVRFSCLARQQNIFIALNIGDRQPCDPDDLRCPEDNGFDYNTNILFDRNGKLIARYHKFNLFLGEMTYWDKTTSAEISFVDTELGRLGFMTCFDILFHDPAIQLVEEYGITTIIFPTAWTNVYPLFPAVAFHSAWAQGMEVNFLSANAREPSKNRTGSGIYTSFGVQSYFHSDDSTDGGRLIIGTLPTSPNRSPKVRWSEHALASSHPSSPGFNSSLFHDEFTFLLLEGEKGVKRVCSNGLCCEVDYEKQKNDEIFALGAFNGMHYEEGQYYLEICVVLKCEGSSINFKCGSGEVKESLTSFASLSISGTFKTSHVFPEVIFDKVTLLPDSHEILENGVLTLTNSSPLITFALFGRNYEKDNIGLAQNASFTTLISFYILASSSLLHLIYY